MPPNEEDLLSLQRYIYGLELAGKLPGQAKWIVYATVDDNLANFLAGHGFYLTEIKHKFRTLPDRLNYALAVGDIKKAFWNYPKTFTPYILQVSDDFVRRNKSKILKERKN